MNRNNLKLIQRPTWRMLVIDLAARLLGLIVHVEGIPVGRTR